MDFVVVVAVVVVCDDGGGRCRRRHSHLPFLHVEAFLSTRLMF